MWSQAIHFRAGNCLTIFHNANHGYIQNLSVKRNSHVHRIIAKNTLHAFQNEANRIYTGILCYDFALKVRANCSTSQFTIQWNHSLFCTMLIVTKNLDRICASKDSYHFGWMIACSWVDFLNELHWEQFFFKSKQSLSSLRNSPKVQHRVRKPKHWSLFSANQSSPYSPAHFIMPRSSKLAPSFRFLD